MFTVFGNLFVLCIRSYGEESGPGSDPIYTKQSPISFICTWVCWYQPCRIAVKSIDSVYEIHTTPCFLGQPWVIIFNYNNTKMLVWHGWGRRHSLFWFRCWNLPFTNPAFFVLASVCTGWCLVCKNCVYACTSHVHAVRTTWPMWHARRMKQPLPKVLGQMPSKSSMSLSAPLFYLSPIFFTVHSARPRGQQQSECCSHGNCRSLNGWIPLSKATAINVPASVSWLHSWSLSSMILSGGLQREVKVFLVLSGEKKFRRDVHVIFTLTHHMLMKEQPRLDMNTS